MKEIWKDIPNFEGMYQASDLGNIKSLYKKFNKEIILKPTIHRSAGHLYVKLSNNHIKKNFYIHRLILETFIGPCPLGMECRHLDGNPKNNKLDNLKWGTRSENCMDAVKHGTKYKPNFVGINHPGVKINDSIVRIIKYLLKTKMFTHKEIALIWNISRHTITKINNKKLWKHII